MANKDHGSIQEAVRGISSNLKASRDFLLVGPHDSFRTRLIHDVAKELGIPVSEWDLLGPSPLTPNLPEVVGGEFVAGGGPDPDRAESMNDDREIIALPPGWYSQLYDAPRQVLVLRDLKPNPANKPEDRRLDDIKALLSSHTFAGYQLPEGVTIALTAATAAPPVRWQSDDLNDFAIAAGLDYIDWRGRDSNDEFLSMISSPQDDPFAWADIPKLMRGGQ